MHAHLHAKIVFRMYPKPIYYHVQTDNDELLIQVLTHVTPAVYWVYTLYAPVNITNGLLDRRMVRTIHVHLDKE